VRIGVGRTEIPGPRWFMVDGQCFTWCWSCCQLISRSDLRHPAPGHPLPLVSYSKCFLQYHAQTGRPFISSPVQRKSAKFYYSAFTNRSASCQQMMQLSQDERGNYSVLLTWQHRTCCLEPHQCLCDCPTLERKKLTLC
jgi:hypothetical protein